MNYDINTIEFYVVVGKVEIMQWIELVILY